LDFDVELDDAAPLLEPPPPAAALDLSGAPDEKVQLSTTADFLDYAQAAAAPAVPDLDIAIDAPVIESASLAQLANQDTTPSVPVVEEPTSPEDTALPLASNADFLSQPELLNTGQAWTPSRP